jgi:hypothetical protein
MHCLYCKKRLGLFASKKRQFCSEVHQAAYHDEQSGLAMRRVMDPLFSTPIKPPPLRTTPEPPLAKEEASETLRLLEPQVPLRGSFCLKQQLPKPSAPNLSAADGLLDVEPFVGSFQLPSSEGGVLEFTLDSEAEPDAEIGAEGGETSLASPSGAPVEATSEPESERDEASEAGETSDVDLTDVAAHCEPPVETESLAGSAYLPSSGSGSEPELAGKIAAKRNESIAFDLAANVHAEAPLEVEPVTGLVYLPSSGSAPGSEPDLAGKVAAALNESISFDLSANAVAETPLEVEPVTGLVYLPSSGSAPSSEPDLAGKVAAALNESISFDLAANAVAETTPEVESLVGRVHLPSSGSAPGSEPELAGKIAAKRNETIAFDLAADTHSAAILDVQPIAGLVCLPSSWSAPHSEPELAGKIAAKRNETVAFDLAANAHAESTLELESLAGPVHLPSSGSAPGSEPELAIKIAAARNETIAFDLAAKAHAEVPLEVQSIAGPVLLPSSKSVPGSRPGLARKIAAKLKAMIAFDLAANAHAEATLELESLAGLMHLPSIGSAPDFEPKLAGEVPAERNEPIAFDLAAAERRSRIAQSEAPLDVELLAGPVKHSPSGGNVAGSTPDSEPELAGKIAASGNEPIAFDLAAAEAQSSHAAHSETPLEAELPAEPVRLPSSGGSAIALTAIEALEENQIIAPPHLLPRLEQVQFVAIAESGSPQPAAGLEPSPVSFAPSNALAGLRMEESAPDLKVDWAPLASLAVSAVLSPNPAKWPHKCISPAAEIEPSPGSTPDDPQGPQRLPCWSTLANIAIAPATLEGHAEPIDCLWCAMPLARPEGEPQPFARLPEADSQDANFPARMYTPVVPGAPVHAEPPPVSAQPIEISPASIPSETRTEPFRWLQAPPVLPSISSATSFRIPFAGAEAAMTVPPSPATVPISPRQESLAGRWPAPQGCESLTGSGGAGPRPANFGIEETQRQEPISLVVELAIPVPDEGRPAMSSPALPHSPSQSESPSLISLISQELSPFHAQGKDRTDELHWPQARLALPPVLLATSFRMHLASVARAAMTLPAFPAMVPACQATPRKEPITPVLALEIPSGAGFCAPFRRELAQSPSHVEATSFSAKPFEISLTQLQRPAQTEEFRRPQAQPALPQADVANSFGIPFVAAKPSRISPVQLQRAAQTEQFRWPQAQPALPQAGAAKSFGIPFVATAKAAMIGRAFRAMSPVPRAIPRQPPIPPVVALKTPISDCPGLVRAPLPAPAFLQPRGILPAARSVRPEPRDFCTKLYIPNAGMRRSSRTPVKLSRTSSSWVRTASSRAAALPSALECRREEIRAIRPWVPFPTMPARAESFALAGVLASVTPAAQDHRGGRFRAFSSAGIQRFRAAAHIQIREPELHNSATGDLPAPSTSLPWRGIPGISEIRLGGSPVPLRPALLTPSVS